MFTCMCLLKLQNVRVYFSLDLFMSEDYKSYEYMHKMSQYFDTGYKPMTYIQRTNLEEDAEVT